MKNVAVGLLLAAASLLIAGCRQDMHNQPKYIPLRESDFWKDGRSARLQVANTVARGQLHEDTYFYTAKLPNGDFGDKLPEELAKMPLKDVLARGQQRYNIYCAPCHSMVGDGKGAVPLRGFNKMPANYHDPRLMKAPLGYFYDVQTNGFGAMLNYAAQVPPQDRWAIATYIRALQFSQDAKLSDVPENERGKIKTMPAPAGPGEHAIGPGTPIHGPNENKNMKPGTEAPKTK
jgi:mono/diheme cytochrome c family protein